MATDSDESTHHDQGGKQAPVAPAHHHGGDQGGDGQGKRQGQKPQVGGVFHAGFDPGSQLVVAVEEPVAQAAKHLGGGGRFGHRLERLGVPQYRQPMGPLDEQAGDPPDGCGQGQDSDADGGAQGLAHRGVALNEHGVQQPCQGTKAHQNEGGGIDAPHDEHGEGEQCRIAPGRSAPARLAHCPGRKGDQPWQCRPWQQDDRDAGGVGQVVRAQGIGQRRNQYRAAPVGGVGPANGAQQVAHTHGSTEQDRPQPQPLGYPVGHTQGVIDPVERAHREQVPDVLVGDGAQPDAVMPDEGGVRQQPRWVEVQVGLGIGADLARRRCQQGNVDEQGRHHDGEPVTPRHPPHQLA